MGTNSIPALLKGLQSKQVDISLGCTQALKEIGEPAVDLMVKLWIYTDIYARSKIEFALKQMGVDVKEHLRERVESPEMRSTYRAHAERRIMMRSNRKRVFCILLFFVAAFATVAFIMHNRSTTARRLAQLHFARDFETVQSILERHPELVDRPDSTGNTLLHRVSYGSWTCTSSNTFSYQSNRGIIRHILPLGVEVNGRNDEGETPLHQAACSHNLEACKLLLEHGAKVNAKTTVELTPLLYAHQVIYLKQPHASGMSNREIFNLSSSQFASAEKLQEARRDSVISLIERSGGTIDESGLRKLIKENVQNRDVIIPYLKESGLLE